MDTKFIKGAVRIEKIKHTANSTLRYGNIELISNS